MMGAWCFGEGGFGKGGDGTRGKPKKCGPIHIYHIFPCQFLLTGLFKKKKNYFYLWDKALF